MTRLAEKPGAVSGSMPEKLPVPSTKAPLFLFVTYLIEQHKKLPHGKQAFKIGRASCRERV